MNLRKSKGYTAEVYTGSLNDIMFFLLLFFLILSTLANPSVIKLLLPKSKSNQTISKPQISLSVTADRTYYVNKTPVPFDQLESELIKDTKNMDEPLIVLRFDNSLSVQDLVDVLQIGSNIKIKMVLGTQAVSSKK